MSKQERLILAVAVVILLLGAMVIFRGTSNTSTDKTIEPIPAPVAGEPAPPKTETPAASEGDGIDVRSYKGRILPLCGLNGNVRIYFKPNENSDSGDKLLDCRTLQGNLEEFGWPAFLIKEGEPDSEWLGIEPKFDMRGIEIQGPAEVRYVKREDIGTPSMLIEGEKRWPLELAWATISASGSKGLMDGFDGWCEHRDQALLLKNLPQNFTIETLIRQRGEDDCST